MEQERKEYLINCFPGIPLYCEEKMKSGKKRACNYVVMVSAQNILFLRCYHRNYNGTIMEVQRFVFAEDGCVRYGINFQTGEWNIRKTITEPKFYRSFYGFRDNSYFMLNQTVIKNTCMEYSMLKDYQGYNLIEYLKFYQKHRNAEYLIKTGYGGLVKEKVEGSSCGSINWKSNNLLEMLGLNKTEFKLLQGKESDYELYCIWRSNFPKCTPEEILSLVHYFGLNWNKIKYLCGETGLSVTQLSRYLIKTNACRLPLRDYDDYISECKKLGYDVKSTQISKPKDFVAAHERTAMMVKNKENEEIRTEFEKRYPERKTLEYSSVSLIIRQPGSFSEIVQEGKVLNHCVGGYAERHARGQLNILFIRTADKPDVPFYTMELSKTGDVVQVRGYGNSNPTDEVKMFIQEYKAYISKLFEKKVGKSA